MNDSSRIFLRLRRGIPLWKLGVFDGGFSSFFLKFFLMEKVSETENKYEDVLLARPSLDVKGVVDRVWCGW